MKRAFSKLNGAPTKAKYEKRTVKAFFNPFIEYVKTLERPFLLLLLPHVQKAFIKNYEIGAFSDDSYWQLMRQYYHKCVVPHKIAVLNFGLELMEMPLIKERFFGEAKTDSYEQSAGMAGRVCLRSGAFLGLLMIHDISKFSLQEEAYAFYRFKDKDPKWFEGFGIGYRSATQEEFDYAWLHHLRNNPHHPGYWVVPTGAHDFYCNEMPVTYLLEMFADWGGASVSYGGALEDWLPKNISKYVFGKKTARTLLELITLYFKDKPEVYEGLRVVDMAGYSYLVKTATTMTTKLADKISKLEELVNEATDNNKTP